jgi:hypothetical protein
MHRSILLLSALPRMAKALLGDVRPIRMPRRGAQRLGMVWIAALFTLVLGACGGGGGSSSPPSTPGGATYAATGSLTGTTVSGVTLTLSGGIDSHHNGFDQRWVSIYGFK